MRQVSPPLLQDHPVYRETRETLDSSVIPPLPPGNLSQRDLAGRFTLYHCVLAMSLSPWGMFTVF